MKKIFYVIVGLLVGYCILCLIGPANVTAEREIVINRPAGDVQHKLADLKFFHDSWSPWTEKDPTMKTTYAGECCEPGSSMSWESKVKDVGNGKMTFEKFNGDSVIETLSFEGMGDSKVYFTSKAEGEGAKVTWAMSSNVPFFGRGFFLFMSMDKMIGPDFEKGLNKLKTALESMPAETAKYDVKEINWDAKTFYGVRGKMEFEKLAGFFGESYGKIGAAIGKAKATPSGAPKAIYFSFDEKTMVADVAAAMEFANGTKLNGLEKWETPASKVLVIDYYGAYDKVGNAHNAMDDYMRGRKVTQQFVIEEYITDPMSEKDTAKWLTKIYYLVK